MTVAVSDQINEKIMIANLRRSWSLFYRSGHVVEVRIFLHSAGKSNLWEGFGATLSGYFDNQDAFVKTVAEIEKRFRPEASYTTINPVDKRLAARANNRFIVAKRGEGASDKDIKGRAWLMIDLDPIRPNGIAATDEEVAIALARRDQILAALTKRGWPEPVMMFSGNGWHLFYQIELSNTDSSRDLLRDVLCGLQLQFSDKDKKDDLGSAVAEGEIGVKLDGSVFNAGRITKLYGTWTRKGDQNDGRFHRQSYVDNIPDFINTVPVDLLDAEAEIYRSYKKEVDASKKKKGSTGGQESIIYRFNRENPIEEIAERCGYKRAGGDRWNHPEGDGRSVLIDKDNGRSMHFSSNDPMRNGHASHDAFDFEVKFRHNDNAQVAIEHWAARYGVLLKGAAHRNGTTNGKVNDYVNLPSEQEKPPEKPETRSGIQAPPVKTDAESIISIIGADNIKKLTFEMFVEDMRRRVCEVFDEDFAISCLRDLESGNAKLLASVLRNFLAYDHTEEAWHWYNNLYWELDKKKNIYYLVSEILKFYYDLLGTRLKSKSKELLKQLESGHDDSIAGRAKFLDDTAKAAFFRSKEMCNISDVRNCIAFAMAGERLGISGDEWDRNTFLLGTQNAIIDLRTQKPVMPLATYYIRTVTKAHYDPSVKYDIWKRVGIEICNGQVWMHSYINRLLGYSMSGSCTESDFFIWYGQEGRNGKELILNVIGEVLGDKLTGVLEPELLLVGSTPNKSGASPQKMSLKGRRIAWASETANGRLFDVAAMKDFSGGIKMQSRDLYGGQVEWYRTHTLILMTNHLPHINSNSTSEWDRIKVIEFPLTFTDNPDPNKPWERLKDTSLFQQIVEKELSGVLNWLLEGYAEYMRIGLATPPEVRQATEKYRVMEDSLGFFFSECCALDGTSEVKRAALFAVYCNHMGTEKRLGKKKFYEEVAKRPGIRLVRSHDGEWYFQGVEIRA